MRKSYGTVKIDKGDWVIECQPHVKLKLKRLFAKIDKYQFGQIRVKMTAESAMDLNWFLRRYPMDLEPQVSRLLETTARDYMARLESLETLLAPDYQARAFPLQKPLRHYQSAAVEVFDRTSALLLADDLGLGKSVSAMGTLTLPKYLPALIVCPVHLVKQWKAFLGEFLPLLNPHIINKASPYDMPAADVYVCSYSKLLGWGDVLGDGRIKCVIFDEVQELRHDDTGKYRAATAIRAGAIAAMGLSATPIYNYGGEIFNILEILAPDHIGSRAEFYREWCTSIGSKGKYLIEDPYAFGEYLRDEFLMLRRSRKDVGLELPAVERSVMSIPHSPEVLKQVEKDATLLARTIFAGDFEESGQAAREFDMKLRQATGVAKAPFVADFVRMIVESGEKVLLFGWHRDVYDIWAERLKDLNPVFYTGHESPSQKSHTVWQFLNSSTAKILIMSLRSGVGVDGLQKVCRTAVFGELDWSPGVHEQCIGRLNRDDGVGGVLGYFLVSDAGSDPFVASILGLKTAQHRGIVDLAKEEETNGIAASQQVIGNRVKELARAFLTKRGVSIPERQQEPKAEQAA